MKRGTTNDLPCLKAFHAMRAAASALPRGKIFISRLCPMGARSKNAVRNIPGVRQVTVTPVPATSADCAAENERINAFERVAGHIRPR